MMAVPAATPVITADELMVATAALPLAHAPPAMASPAVRVAPTHTLAPPVMAGGIGFTVSDRVTEQPVDSKV